MTLVFADGHREDVDTSSEWYQKASLLDAVKVRLMAVDTADGHAGGWTTVRHLTDAVRYLTRNDGLTEATVDARCRELRSERGGRHIVEAVNGQRRIIPHGSPTWEALTAAAAATARPDVEVAADELSAWLDKWRHVLSEKHTKRLKSMAGLILRESGLRRQMPGQLSIEDEVTT